jgi:hypothetical protein
MAFEITQWFIHGVDENVTHLAQQKDSKISGSVRMKTGVIGKTQPFQRLGTVEMVPAVRDSDTTYMNPPQTKRRAVLLDMNAAVLIDELDELKTLTNPMSEFAQMLANARNRQIDRFVLSPSLTGAGGVLGLATTVDEGAETSGTAALPAGQQIAAGGTGLTMAKLRDTKLILDNADVEEDDRYFWTSPEGIQDLLADNTVTSSDFNTIKALVAGGFPMDQTWMGFKWRTSTLLPLAASIRNCFAYQKLGVGCAVGIKSISVSTAPHKWDNHQAIIKLSAGAVRIDDSRVVSVLIDESV